MNRFKMINKFSQIIKLIKFPWSKILNKKYIKPLKDVKHEKNPLNIMFSFEKLNLFAITIPTNNDPNIEIIKLLLINTLKKVAA